MRTDVDLRHHGDAEVGPGLVDLAVNVRAGTPPEWLAALLRDSVAGLAAYPDPSGARRAVARRHGRSADEVLLTAGAAEAFVLLARVLAPRRAVVVHPQFTEPESALRAAGHAVSRVVLPPDFRLGPVPGDADLVMVGNPTNPTSVLHPAGDLAALARPGRVLVVDEAFMDCVPGETESLADRRLPGLVVVRSLTKTWGLAGLRAGYVLAEPGLIERLAAAQPLWSVSTPALVAAEACVSPRALAEVEAWARDLAADRDRLVTALDGLGLRVVPGARASFVCVRVPGGLAVRQALRELGYAVRRGDTFPGLGPDWLRVAVRDEETVTAFTAALAAVLHPPTGTDPPRRTMDLIAETIAAIRPPDATAMDAARAHQDRLTKPRGALGALEELSVRLAGVAGACPPPLPEPAAVAVFAADHGVHAQGVTPWPQEVTGQMVQNFLAGGAVVNAFAREVGADVRVVDVGVRTDLPAADGLLVRKTAHGTADLTLGPAMTPEQVRAAVEAGIETARELVADGHRCLITGDMGIANTTASAALIAAFTGRAPEDVTGHGTGIDAATHARKVEVVRTALDRARPELGGPLEILAQVGGLEHAAITGFILGGAAARVPVLLDGVIAGAAALAAVALAPDARAVCVAGHRSAEPGHAVALAHLELTPLVDLGLRLGEGTGALLALPLARAAVRVLHEVATFDSAGVADKA
jgi:nicotinate-nucleotide--dimethylbenzimidazole phosphoribosyltransferase